MKTLIAASLLLALASPAYPGSGAEWDCGKGVTAGANREKLGIWFATGPDRSSPDQTGWQLEGSRHFHLKWSKNGDIWLNGRKCKQTN
jgi:hypothetical protein